jgi:trehalose-6-phosphate synthase
VLLLSETAGASLELDQALLINPLDPEGFADTLHWAVTMPVAERRERMAAMRARIQQHTIYHWMQAIFDWLEEVSNTYARS